LAELAVNPTINYPITRLSNYPIQYVCTAVVCLALGVPALAAPKVIKAGRLIDPSGRVTLNAV